MLGRLAAPTDLDGHFGTALELHRATLDGFELGKTRLAAGARPQFAGGAGRLHPSRRANVGGDRRPRAGGNRDNGDRLAVPSQEVGDSRLIGGSPPSAVCARSVL
jgi:hypothetical protein